MAEANKISRSGLAKWVVISTLDPEFSKELFEGLFFLSAWESYSFWKSNPKDNEEFAWEGKIILWQEWQEWRKLKDIQPDDKSKKDGKEEEKRCGDQPLRIYGDGLLFMRNGRERKIFLSQSF